MMELAKYLQTGSGDFQFSLYRLVTIGVPGKHDGTGFPLFMIKLFSQELSGIFFDDDFLFKIQACRKAPILMGISCITIHTSMLTSLIRIDGIIGGYIRAGNFIQNLLGMLIKNLGLGIGHQSFIQAIFCLGFILLLEIRIGGIDLSAPSF